MVSLVFQVAVLSKVFFDYNLNSWRFNCTAAKSKSAAQRNRTLKQAPEMFDKMVERFGPEAAVESFIRSSVIG